MSGAGYKRDRLVLDQTHVLKPVPFELGTVKTRLSFSTPYSGPLAEPNTWLMSFLIAAVFHAGFFFAVKNLWRTPPEYGIQSTAASMEVYMVAALPEPVPAVPVTPVQKNVPELVGAPSEVIVAKVEKPVEEKKIEQSQKVETEKSQAKSEVKGDGSSKNPGESETTLTSQASSETFGKSGKYQNPPPQYPSLAERNGWEGTVTLKAFVEREGRASQVLIDRSSGFKVLDKAALKTIQKWQFEPSRLGSSVVSAWIKIPVRFRIEKNL